MRAETDPQRRAPAEARPDTPAAPGKAKAAFVAIEPEVATRSAMTLIFAACKEHWTANEAAAIDGGDPEGVHQLRVGLRRFRSALTVFAPLLPPEQLALMKEDARWAVQELNAARDWDVLLTEIVPPVAEARGDAPFTRLRAAAEAERRRGYNGVGAMLRAERYSGFVARLNEWCTEQAGLGSVDDDARRRLDAPVAAYAQDLLAKRHKTALKRGRGFDGQSSEQRHQVRIALKKLRYATEFFQSLFPKKRTEGYLARLKRLQDDLGHLNDVAVADRLLRSLIGASNGEDAVDLALAAGQVQGWYARGVAILEPEARRDWASFRKSKRFWTPSARQS